MTTSLIFHIYKTSRAFDILIHSRALLAARHSVLVSDSVGITSSCSLLAFPLSVSLYVASTSQYPSLTHNCRYTKKPSKLPKSFKVRSHGNNVRDVIIVHVISAEAQIIDSIFPSSCNIRLQRRQPCHPIKLQKDLNSAL